MSPFSNYLGSFIAFVIEYSIATFPPVYQIYAFFFILMEVKKKTKLVVALKRPIIYNIDVRKEINQKCGVKQLLRRGAFLAVTAGWLSSIGSDIGGNIPRYTISAPQNPYSSSQTADGIAIPFPTPTESPTATVTVFGPVVQTHDTAYQPQKIEVIPSPYEQITDMNAYSVLGKPTISLSVFRQELIDLHSPVEENGYDGAKAIYDACVAEDVDPAALLAVWIQESVVGNFDFRDNVGNIRYVPGVPQAGGFADFAQVYPNVVSADVASTIAWCKLVHQWVDKDPKYKKYKNLIYLFTPPSDNNQTDLYYVGCTTNIAKWNAQSIAENPTQYIPYPALGGFMPIAA